MHYNFLILIPFYHLYLFFLLARNLEQNVLKFALIFIIYDIILRWYLYFSEIIVKAFFRTRVLKFSLKSMYYNF